MPNICLTFGTNTAAPKIVEALTSLKGLASWWTHESTGNPQQGGTVTFTFGGNGGFDMRIIKSDAQQVHWECIKGPDDWLGTRIEFDIQTKETHNQVMFRTVSLTRSVGTYRTITPSEDRMLISEIK